MRKKILIGVLAGILLFSLAILSIVYRKNFIDIFKNDKDKTEIESRDTDSVNNSYKDMNFLLNQYGVEGDSIANKITLTLSIPDDVSINLNDVKTELTLKNSNLTFFIGTVQEGTFDQYETNNPYAKVTLPYYKVEVFREATTSSLEISSEGSLSPGILYDYKTDYSTDKIKCTGAPSCGTSWVNFGDIDEEDSVSLIVTCGINEKETVATCDRIVQSIRTSYLK